MATASSDPLTSSLVKWQDRIRTATQAGLPPSSYLELAKHDIHNVMQGGQPMADMEANLAIVSAATKNPVINDPQRHTGPLDILGNVPADVGGIVRGLNPVNIVKTIGGDVVKAVTHPQMLSPWTEQGWAPAANRELPFLSRTAADLRSAAAAPVIRLIPGMHTLAGLTTSQGRKELERHPVGTALDILPFASDVGEALTAGKVAEAGSAIEALQQGRVVRAGVRTVVPNKLRAVSDELLKSSLLSNDVREMISRPHSQINRKVQNDLYKYYKEEVLPVVGKLDSTERAQLYDEATRYNPADTTISAEHHAILGRVRNMTDMLRQHGEDNKALAEVVAPNGTIHTYSATDDVAMHYRKAMGNAERVNKLVDRVSAAKAKLEDRQLALANRTGKVRRFMEDDASFANRAEGPVGIAVVHDAIQSLVEKFRYLNPRDAFPEFMAKIEDGTLPHQAAVQLGKDMKLLEGDAGLFAKLDDSLASNDLATARTSATQIARLFKHQAWQNAATGVRFRSYMGEIRDELIGLSGRERTHGYAARLVNTQERYVANAEAKLTRGQTSLNRHMTNYLTELTKSPPAAFHPLIASNIREGAAKIAATIHTGQQLEAALNTIRESPRMQDLESAIGKEEFAKLYADSTENWLNLTEKGYAPVWMHHVERDRYERIMHPSILPDRILRPGQWEEKILNFAPAYADIAASVTDAAAQLIARDGTIEFVNKHIMPFAKPLSVLESELRDTIRNGRPLDPGDSIAAAAKSELKKNWADFDPEKYGVRNSVRVTGAEQLVVPKHIATTLDVMMKGGFKLPLGAAYNKVMHVYKFSVLTGPRHLAHVAFGGTMFMLLREPKGLLYLRQAAKMVREGTAPVELTSGLYNLSTDQIFHFAAGKTMARLYAEKAGGTLQAYARFEERISQVQRVADLLSQESRGVSREAALHEAYKTFVDIDAMSPIERTIIKQVFPFYAFTRHLFRYLLSYPVDHPYRAAILSRASEQEMADWNTGLPTKFQQLFFLGQPNARGNVRAVELRALNPFRSFANDFTLAGFVSSLNPLLTGVMQASGVNVLSATPDLYPEISYDADTGSLKAKRPSDVPFILGQSIIPELGAVDHFVGLTDQMRQLKKSNPDAYRKLLFSNLNIPFYPTTENPSYARGKAEVNRYKAAQAAVSNAKGGSNGEITRYNLVPYQGQLVAPSVVTNQLNDVRSQLASRGFGNIAPSAVMSRSQARKAAAQAAKGAAAPTSRPNPARR